MRYYLCCLILGAGLAHGFELWESAHDWPPVALCPNVDAVIVSTNPWRIDSPTRSVIPTCEVYLPRMTNTQPVAPTEDTTNG